MHRRSAHWIVVAVAVSAVTPTSMVPCLMPTVISSSSVMPRLVPTMMRNDVVPNVVPCLMSTVVHTYVMPSLVPIVMPIVSAVSWVASTMGFVGRHIVGLMAASHN